VVEEMPVVSMGFLAQMPLHVSTGFQIRCQFIR